MNGSCCPKRAASILGGNRVGGGDRIRARVTRAQESPGSGFEIGSRVALVTGARRHNDARAAVLDGAEPVGSTFVVASQLYSQWS